ncbi:type II toxin-antitoxin system RelE/ParE family toxin [Flaviaesturariibacter amylovorans]|uniref:Plasmid maintenance system killer protein n=1 Tax=Flaviaesturariibacter amylovorans TaxID=1084520 RepID=A0ABP8HP95_9BACT
MDIEFATQMLADLYAGKVENYNEFRSNPTLVKQYIKAITMLRAALRIEQLFQFNGLRYKKLSGDLKGYSSVRINKQYRILFTEVVSETDAPQINLIRLEEINKHYE